MGTYTLVYNLYKPAVGERGWGLLVDASLDTIDAALADLDTRTAGLEGTASLGFWAPLTNGDPDDPGIIFFDGQVVMVFMEP
jgi:hypothetical protein